MNQPRAPPYAAASATMPAAGQAAADVQGEAHTGFSAPATVIPAQAEVRSIPATAHGADLLSNAPRAIYAAPPTSYAGSAAATTTTESYLPPGTSYSQVPPTFVGSQAADLAGYAPPATNYLPAAAGPSASYAPPATSYAWGAHSEARVPSTQYAAVEPASLPAGAPAEPTIADYSVPQTCYNGAGSS